MLGLYLGWLNEIGSWLAVAGGLIIFRWGRSQPSTQTYESLSVAVTPLSDRCKSSKMEAEAIRKTYHYRIMSCIGVALVIVGFALRAISDQPLLGTSAP